MGITMPVLYDHRGEVHKQYQQGRAGVGASFPHNWLIGVDGRVLHMSFEYEHAILTRLIESELGQP